MEKMEINFGQKSTKIYTCCLCDYNTSRKSHYLRHTDTEKHKWKYLEIEKYQKVPNDIVCECGKTFKTNSGAWKHRKRCTFVEDSIKLNTLSNNNSTQDIKTDDKSDDKTDYKLDDKIIVGDSDNIDYKSMFMKLIDENSEFKNILITQQNQLIEQQKQIGELIPKIGNNNTVNNKQNFNINIFLNEYCKDALNISDFVNNIQISMDQLNYTTTKGLTEGLSNILIDNINKLSVYERPLHCTDIKRETLYIKDHDVWEKDQDKTKIVSAIKDTCALQYRNMKLWMDANPDYMEDPDKQQYFINMVRNCGKNTDEIEDKIIKRLCTSNYIKDNIKEKIKIEK